MAEKMVSIQVICRSCLKPTCKKYTLTGSLISLEVTIADMLQFCTSKELDLSEDLPANVCTFCYRTIRMSYEFFKQFYNSQDQLNACKENQNVIQEVFPHFVGIHSYAEPSVNTEHIDLDYENEQEINKYVDSHVDTFSNEADKEDVLEFLDVDVNRDNAHLLNQEDEDIHSNVNISDLEPTVIIKNRENQDEKLYPYICPICTTKLSRIEPFHKHLLEHKCSTIICARCTAKPEYEVEEYIKHYKEFHKWQCEICNKKMASSFGYKYHMKQHTNMSCYKCPIKECNRSFVLRSLLRKHIKNHYQPPVFPCHLCSSTFNNRDTLSYHLKKHFNKKDHLCTICGRTFYLAGHLTDHMHRHAGHKRFGCDICEKRFTTSTCLKKHTVRCIKKHNSYEITEFGLDVKEKNEIEKC